MHRADAYLDAGRLLPAVESLRDARWGFLTAITGLDDVKANEIEVLYHFVNGAANRELCACAFRATTRRFPAFAASMPGATFFERELSEMFGIERAGHAQSRSVVPARPMADGRAAAAQRFCHAADAVEM